jgi:hypothetical protein
MTPGFALLLLGAVFYGFIACFGREAPKAFLFFAWGAMALGVLWAVGAAAWKLLAG